MKLYIASDIRHAQQWIYFRELCYPTIIVVSSWIDFLVDGEPPNLSEKTIEKSWENNINDLALCNVLMLYHERGDSLRGALFEAGIAFAMKKPIMFVGDRNILGTLRVCFQHSDNLDEAVTTLHSVKLDMFEKGSTH